MVKWRNLIIPFTPLPLLLLILIFLRLYRRISSNLIINKNNINCNYLIRNLGAWPLAHIPCAFDCAPSNDLMAKTLNIILNLTIANDLHQILNFTVESSLLHGIREIKFPICEIATNAIATAHKHIIRVEGNCYPDNVSNGMLFPYRIPSCLRLSDSKGYKTGLKNISSQPV